MNDRVSRRHRETDTEVDLHTALDHFTFEVALLFFRMRVAATQYLGRGEHSSGHRSVLKSLGGNGPQTVPAMARLRSVSRQHVQKLVDGLKADGLVTTRPNPGHKRSVLIVLTRKGEEYLHQMNWREKELWRFLGRDLSSERVAAATDVARLLRTRFDSEAWMKLAESGLETD